MSSYKLIAIYKNSNLKTMAVIAIGTICDCDDFTRIESRETFIHQIHRESFHTLTVRTVFYCPFLLRTNELKSQKKTFYQSSR